jgi:hypothetical protein
MPHPVLFVQARRISPQAKAVTCQAITEGWAEKDVRAEVQRLKANDTPQPLPGRAKRSYFQPGRSDIGEL